MKWKVLTIILVVVLLFASIALPANPITCSGKRGDVNNDGVINGGDVTALVLLLNYGAPIPECLGQCDVNADGFIYFDDITYLILYLQGQYEIPD